MATNSYTKLHRAVRAGQLAEAHDLFKDIMQQKVANRLAEERKHLTEDELKSCCKVAVKLGGKKCPVCDKVLKEDFGASKACPKCKHSLKEHGEEGCDHSGCKCMESAVSETTKEEPRRRPWGVSDPDDDGKK